MHSVSCNQARALADVQNQVQSPKSRDRRQLSTQLIHKARTYQYAKKVGVYEREPSTDLNLKFLSLKR
jgi:hypothetical protein